MGVNPALMSSARDSWNTPPEVLELVRRLGPIGLDPCSNAGSIVGASEEWRLERGEDGLARPWALAGLVYVNPPYGREIGPWAQKMAAEGRAGVEIVALLPARTDARWWQESVRTADALLFWRGRLRFLGAPSSAPFPSAVAYWGPRWLTFLSVFGERGHGVRP
jgi:hypothetical protein